MRKSSLFPATVLGLIPVLALFLTLCGCHKSQPSQPTTGESQPAAAIDPAEANLAYASNTQTGEQNPPPPPSDNGAAPNASQVIQQGYPSGPAASYSQSQAPPDQTDQGYPEYDQGSYDNEPPVYASEPPPPLPDYDQPDCPGDDYLWTPGYWAWSPQGYYWVPGAWVLAPYLGALWTPGYWGFYGGRYRWYHGYWGPHIGYYGGVNYGYGYNGAGYEGGYWNHDHFEYNRAVTRVGGGIRNVYSYPVNNRFNQSRISYNGGRGGLNYRPTASQLAATRETHLGALPAQREQARSAEANRGQFAAVNHGRPAMVAESRGINDGRRAPGAPPANFHAAPSLGRVETNPAVGRGGALGNPPNRGAMPVRPNNNVRPAISRGRGPAEPGAEARSAARPENGPERAPNRPENRSAPPRPQNEPNRGNFRAQPQPQYRPQAPARPQSRPEQQPQHRPEPRPQTRPEEQPQYRPEPRPQPRPQPERPQPESRPESRPAPNAEPRPEPQQRPQSPPHGDEHPH
jgi:WXXGXW repeat (2 copies)